MSLRGDSSFSEADDRKRLRIALCANGVMFVVGMFGWRLAESTSLLGDALDMLADASGYVFALVAIGRDLRFKRMAARWNGLMLILLGVGVIGEVVHRFLVGSSPLGTLMVGFALLSVVVNGSVLRMLSRYRYSSEVHLRAAWIDTRADVMVNLVVLVSGAVVLTTGFHEVDLVAGFAIGAYVMYEGFELVSES